jgi:hypothetical protein
MTSIYCGREKPLASKFSAISMACGPMGVGFILAKFEGMLTRREVLLQLKRVGVTEAAQMKTFLRDFEKYMAEYHGVVVEGARKTIAGKGSEKEQEIGEK